MKKIILKIAISLTIASPAIFAGKIHDAIENGDIQKVQELLGNNPECVNEADGYSRTPLCWACYHGNLDIVKLLLENEVKESINIPDKDGRTPLFLACYCDNLKMVKLLLENGAKESINRPNNYGPTPLCLACRANSLEVVKLLLENGAKESINKACNEYVPTPLYWACYHGNLDIVKLLLENGATISQDDIDTTADQSIKPYLRAAQEYTATENKIDFILSKQSENNSEIFNLLVRLCFCESMRKITNKMQNFKITEFFKIYKNQKIKFRNIFNVERKQDDDHIEFIEDVIAKNDFYFDKAKMNSFYVGAHLKKQMEKLKNCNVVIKCIN